MKHYIAIVFFIALLISSSSYFIGTAKANDLLSVKLIGCAGKPYAGQTIQLQKLPCPVTTPNCKWETIKSYTTDNNGYVYLEADDEPKIELDKHLYRFYWEKSSWVRSWVTILTFKQDYVIGYDIDNIPLVQKRAEDLNDRIYSGALKEFQWSGDHYQNLLAQANKINDKQVLINKILVFMVVWTDPDYDTIKASLNKYSLVELRQQYVDIRSETENSQRYHRRTSGYALWCTAFSNYVLAKDAGGPSVVGSPKTNAKAFGEWFKKSGDVRGLDGEMYRRTYLSDTNLLNIFKNTQTIPMQKGNFFLEKAVGLTYSGHSAVGFDVTKFPEVEFIAGNVDMLVAKYLHDYREKSGLDAFFTKIYGHNVYFYYGAGKLECVQNP